MTALHDCVTRQCAVCAKEFGVLYPDRWAYKWRVGANSYRWFCSWRCLREKERENEQMEAIVRAHRITPEEKAETVRRAIEDGSPYQYLNELGVKNPYSTWKHLKQHLKDHDPETFEKLPERFRGGRGGRPKQAEGAPEAVPAPAAEEPVKAEAPVKPAKGRNPMKYDKFTVRAVQGDFGRYSFDPHTSPTGQQYLDYANEAGDELSMTVEQWRLFVRELRDAAAVLGVEL